MAVEMESQELLTLPEVCARLRVPMSTLRRWIREGRLETVRLAGQTRRIDPAELRRFIDAARVTAKR